MNPDCRPRVFLSYSHSDAAIALKLSHDLRAHGQDIWLDQWEILAGDSIVDKIFGEGLSEASAFLILLSKSSINSKWVKEELNFATIKRIEKYAKVVPILLEPVEMPSPLRSLKWVDMRRDYDRGVQEVLHSLTGLRERPPLGRTPAYLNNLVEIDGLSRLAGMVGLFILREHKEDEGIMKSFTGDYLSSGTGLEPEEISDAIDELEDRGLVQKVVTMGNAPYRFMWVEPTYLLWMEYSAYVVYDPKEDVFAVARAIAALNEAEGDDIQARTSLSVGRINRAVDYIREYGLADVDRWMGTAPYTFGRARATFRTRQA